MTVATTILVTGKHGQLARAMAERAALSSELSVVCLGRPELDLETHGTIGAAIRKIAPDIVVNAAAFTAVDLAEDQPDAAHAINAAAAGYIAAAARAIGAPIIQISTDYIYDGSKTSSYVEADRANPQSVYGRTKLEGEKRVQAENPDHVVLRTAWVYSPFGKNFIKTMLELARTRDTLNVVGDQYGNPTSAIDLADAVLEIIKRWQSAPATGLGQIYHCAGSGETNWCNLARHTFETSRRQGGPYAEVSPILARDWPAKAARPINSRLDCTAFATDFGWRAPEWQRSVDLVVSRLLSAKTEATA